MTLNIKNPETTRLIHELAEETGESMTQALTTAVRQRLVRVRADAKRDEVLALVEEIRARVPEGYFDQDFDRLLYDEATGLPK